MKFRFLALFVVYAALLAPIIIFLAVFIVRVYAQYPFIQDGDTTDIGLCMSNADCDIYAAQFNLQPGQIQCYQPFMKCISPGGKILGPAFDIQCNASIIQISSTVPYPSIKCFGSPAAGDGIITVTMTANPPQRLKGLIRLYMQEIPLNYTNNTFYMPYLSQVYANYPQTVYQFANLLPGTYTVIYFDIIGCWAPSPLSSVGILVQNALSNASNSYIPVATYSCGGNGFLGINPVYFSVDDSTARALRVGIPQAQCTFGPWPTGLIHTQYVQGRGNRVPVANVYGPDGELIASYAAGQTCLSSTGTLGITLPLFARNSSTYYSSTLSQSANAGFWVIEFGFGYYYIPSNSPSAVPQYLYYSEGEYRGSFLPPFVVDMTNTSFGIPAGTNPAVQPYYHLNGVFTNTQIMYNPVSYFNGRDLTKWPIITALQDNTNYTQSTFAACFTAQSTTVTIKANYAGIQPVKGSAVEMLAVVNGSYKKLNPPQSFVISVLQPVPTFTLNDAGLYCLSYTANAFDGYGTRILLYSCFVFGNPTTWLLQLSSALSANPNSIPGYPVPYAAYKNGVDTLFILGLPVIMFAPVDFEPYVTLSLSSSDPFFEGHLERIGATSYNVFNDQAGRWSLSNWYDISQPYGGGITLFVANTNTETNSQITVTTTEGDVVGGLVAMSVTQLVNASDFDYYEVTQNTQYSCAVPTVLNMMELYSLSVSVSANEPICPDQLTVLTLYAEGGVCYHMTTLSYLNNTNTPTGGIVNPFTMPCGYWFQVQNYDPTSPGYLTFLQSSLGLATYNAPTNTVLRVIAHDASSNVAYTVITSESIIPPNTTVIDFVSQELFCVNQTQYSEIVFSVYTTAPVNASEIIAYWVRTDLTTLELYDPNDLYFDLPQDCPYLLNMTAYEVQQYCYGPIGSQDPICLELCINLPPAYPNVEGFTLTSGTDGDYWDAVAWVPSGFFNNDTGRPVYCRTGNSIRVDIPDTLAMQITGPQIIQVNYPPVTCEGNNCYKIAITVIIDTIYTDIINNVTIVSNPALGKNQFAVPALLPNEYTVNLGVEYTITVMANGLCPYTQVYTFNVTGPLITGINIFDSVCSLDDGSVNMVLYYYDSDASLTGNVIDLCFYMPSWNGAPLPFAAPINEELYLPTEGLGFDMQQFTPVKPGSTNVWIYQICQGGETNPTPNCFSCVTLPQGTSETFYIQPGYLYTYRNFFVPTMASESGGIQIVQNTYVEAPCYGDSYYFSYSIYDDAGPDGIGYPPYVVQFLNPVGTILKTFGCCVNTLVAPNCVGELPPPTPVGGGRVLIGVFNFSLSTGSNFGFQLSGNYTFVVKSCNSSCVNGYPTWIDIVNPIIITLDATQSTCNSQNPSLSSTISGGAGFYSSNDALNVTYVDPSTGLLIYSPYIQCWYTPFNPTECIQMYLPLHVVPGNYTLCATDRNGCKECASTLVTNVAPVTAELLGYDAYCSTSSYAVATFNISGPNPPYYILEYLDQVSEGDLINITIWSTYNKTIEFRIMNSLGCITNTVYRFNPPAPPPENFTVATTPSCPAPLVPTGTMTVIDSENYTCQWMASGIIIENYNLCHQVNVPPGVQYIVTIFNFAGCSSQSDPITVSARNPIYLSQPIRTENGLLHGPCIDFIYVTVYGGEPFAPPYHAVVINPTPGMNVTFVNISSLVINAVCRGVSYTLSVSANDYMCAITTVITDPYYDTGGSSPQIPSLKTPNNDFFPNPQNKHGSISPEEGAVISFSVLLFVFLVAAVVGTVYYVNNKK